MGYLRLSNILFMLLVAPSSALKAWIDSRFVLATKSMLSAYVSVCKLLKIFSSLINSLPLIKYKIYSQINLLASRALSQNTLIYLTFWRIKRFSPHMMPSLETHRQILGDCYRSGVRNKTFGLRKCLFGLLL